MNTIDVTNPAQNAFVQDWLEAWQKKYITDEDEGLAVSTTVEMIQETFSFTSLEVAYRTLEDLYRATEGHPAPLHDNIQLVASFCKAVAYQKGETWAKPNDLAATT